MSDKFMTDAEWESLSAESRHNINLEFSTLQLQIIDLSKKLVKAEKDAKDWMEISAQNKVDGMRWMNRADRIIEIIKGHAASEEYKQWDADDKFHEGIYERTRNLLTNILDNIEKEKAKDVIKEVKVVGDGNCQTTE